MKFPDEIAKTLVKPDGSRLQSPNSSMAMQAKDSGLDKRIRIPELKIEP
jgi:hypothetical protein